MKSKIGCCFECPERHPACHDTCEKYKEARQRWLEERHYINQARSREINYRDFKVQNICKTRNKPQGQR